MTAQINGTTRKMKSKSNSSVSGDQWNISCLRHFEKFSFRIQHSWGEIGFQSDGTLQMQSLQGYQPSTEAVKR